MNEIEVYIQGYVEYLLDVRKLKKDSVKDVRCTFNRLKEFVELKGYSPYFWNLEIEEFASFFKFCLEEGKSPKSVQKFVTHLRSFLNYSWRVGKVNRNVLEGYSIKSASKRIPPRVLSFDLNWS